MRRDSFSRYGTREGQVIKNVLEGKTNLPSTLIDPSQGELIFLLDREASSQIHLQDQCLFL